MTFTSLQCPLVEHTGKIICQTSDHFEQDFLKVGKKKKTSWWTNVIHFSRIPNNYLRRNFQGFSSIGAFSLSLSQHPSNRTADGPSPLAPLIPTPTLVPKGISNFLGSLSSPEVFFSGLQQIYFSLLTSFYEITWIVQTLPTPSMNPE